jgi:hypothetical protein
VPFIHYHQLEILEEAGRFFIGEKEGETLRRGD